MSKVIRQIWYRKDNETDVQFKAFRIYLDMGTDRTVLKSYRAYSGKEQAICPGGTFQTWSQQHDWIERARAFDIWCSSVDDAGYEKAAAKEQAKCAKERARANASGIEMAGLLIEKAKMMLKAPLFQQEIVSEEKDERGNVVKVTKIIMPSKFKVADAARIMEVADKIWRLSTDMSTDNVSFNLNEQLKRVSEETGVPIHVLTEEYRQMTGKHPPKLLAVNANH